MRFTILSALICALLPVCLAQLGPVITYPASNATVDPGSKVTLQFSYQNMGDGAYSADIALWEDASATLWLEDVVKGYDLSPGNSSGSFIPFNYNGTYDWWVPHGMNFTFYLTVTERANTTGAGNLTLRSMPLMLHPSSAWAMLPNTFLALIVSCVTLSLLM
ncbi:hypothetical protein BC940DRAFT_291096 [Gongronella butleri]|nr:hypothetical protein BC940DRAFT_291096 [Gongronella butleri]